ncbi:MAG: putative TetR family transcriptional regulator [Acidimicrobiales bacterium]|nr:putative TetR family transcriptional regulator [Acidimicrobiales bacterium]
MVNDQDAANIDGRTARRDRNREAVLDAALDLFSEGHLNPSAPDVAARSGVSLRSVFRYYEDTEALLRAAMARNFERVSPLFHIADLGQGPLEERLERYVAGRLCLYEAVAPMARAAIVRAAGNALIAAQLDGTRSAGRAQLEEMFAPELTALPPPDRRAATAAADTLMQFESLEHLHVRGGLSPSETAAVLRSGLRSLLVPAGTATER